MNTDSRPERRSLRTDVAYASLSLGLIAGVFYLFHFQPVTYLRLISEDQWGEYATAVILLLAAIGVLKLAWTHGTRYHKAIWTAIGVGLLFICGEELSWGQRIFDLETPRFLMARNTQGELTIHNLKGGYAVRMAAVYLLVAWSVVSIAIAALAGRIGDLEARYGIPVFRPGIVLFTLSLSYFEIAKPVYRSDEIGELFLAMTALVWAIDLNYRFAYRPSLPTWRKTITGCFVLLSVAAGIAVLMAEKIDHRWDWKRELSFHAMHYLHDFGMVDQAERVIRYLQGTKYYNIEAQLDFIKVLRRAGKIDEASAILKETRSLLIESVATEKFNAREWRQLGSVHLQMTEVDLANDAFDRALDVDRNRLLVATDDDEKARIKWSMAKTMAERYDAARARSIGLEAIELAQSEEIRTRVHWWLHTLERTD